MIIAALAISKLMHVHFPAPVGSGCAVHGDRFAVTLDTGQASIAATIAGVATHRAMPVRAVTIAYSAAVPHYQQIRVFKAAQAVQHSADGLAYSQYGPQGADMAWGFSGQRPRAVWCWYGSGISGHSRLSAAGTQLQRTFGRLTISRAGDPVARVRVRRSSVGWAVAAWLVSHASRFEIRQVSYQGYQWTAAHGRKGWIARPRQRPAAAARLGVTFG